MLNLTVKTTASRVLLMLGLLFVLSTTAAAYTLVLRSGRHMEISDRFVLSKTTVICEVAPGMSVTVPMAAIDIPATERANNESPGSFAKRLQQAETNAHTSDQSPSPHSQTQNARSITNRDLESFARARSESEAAYEKRRIELGLPTLEESRRRAERDATSLDELVAKKRKEESEAYWRERAAELQAEIDAINREMNSQDYQFGDGSILVANGGFGAFNSRLHSGFHRRFPSVFNQGSPCGFNPGISCLQTFPFGVNREFVRPRPLIFVAPGAHLGGRRFGGGHILVGPGRH